MTNRLPVIVVSGFLGSGKTTFLRYLIRQCDKKFGLLINEFGEVGIDGDLVKSCNSCNKDSDNRVIELTNGCICCTVQDDFIPSLRSLLNRNHDIEAIIIETSGLTLPLPLLQALNWPEIRTSVYLDFVITLVNGDSMVKGLPINDFDSIKNQYEATRIIEHKLSLNELFNEQLEVSDFVLISRSDLLTNAQFKRIKLVIQEKINANVPILKCINGEINLSYIFDSVEQKNNHCQLMKNKNKNEHEHEHEHLEIFSKAYKSNYFLEKPEFDVMMKLFLLELNILRIKGRIWIPNKDLPLQIQIVGKKINSWFEEAPLDCWRPKNGGGIEIVMIGFDRNEFSILERKITDKFNILGDPNL